MSVKLMTWAWTVDLPATDKLVLIALSDHANDEDHTCWPSITHLSEKCGVSRRTIISVINRLEKKNIIKRTKRTRDKTTLYTINYGSEDISLLDNKYVKKSAKAASEDISPPDGGSEDISLVQLTTCGGETDAGGGEIDDHSVVKQLHPEPSLKSSRNIKEPSDQKNKPVLVDLIKNQKTEIKNILDFLNTKTGMSYQGVNPNKTSNDNYFIVKNLLDLGYTAQDCKTVIVKQSNAWRGNKKMRDHLTPKTLFSPKNFITYFGRCVEEVANE